MAGKITVRSQQSMQDVIIMACGTLEGGMAFCALNDVALSDVPVPGTVYEIPDLPDGITRKGAAVLKYYLQNEIKAGTLGDPIPATRYVTEDEGDYYVTEDGDQLITED